MTCAWTGSAGAKSLVETLKVENWRNSSTSSQNDTRHFVTYGLGASADWRAIMLVPNPWGGTDYTVVSAWHTFFYIDVLFLFFWLAKLQQASEVCLYMELKHHVQNTLRCITTDPSFCDHLLQVYNNRPMVRVSLRLPGMHNVLNSLAVSALDFLRKFPS